MRLRSSPVLLAGMSMVFTLTGCGEDPTRPPLTDGVMGTFVAEGDTFKVWVTDQAARNELVAVWNGQSNKSIPDGTLNLGPGTLQYNDPWSWHIDQDEIEMVETAAPECDASPSEVEANLAEWINDRQRFCPSGSQLIFLESL